MFFLRVYRKRYVPEMYGARENVLRRNFCTSPVLSKIPPPHWMETPENIGKSKPEDVFFSIGGIRGGISSSGIMTAAVVAAATTGEAVVAVAAKAAEK